MAVRGSFCPRYSRRWSPGLAGCPARPSAPSPHSPRPWCPTLKSLNTPQSSVTFMWCQLPALGQQLWLTLAIVKNIPNWSPSVLMALLRKISHSPPPSLGFRSLNWLCWSLLRLATSLRTVCWSVSSARRVNAACSLQMSSPDLIFRLDMKPLPLPSMSWDSRHNVYPLPCIAKFLPLWDNSCNFFCEFSSFLSDNFDYSKKSEGNLCLISGK